MTERKKIKILNDKIKEREENIKELKNAKKIAREGSTRVNKELNESKLRLYQEKASINKQQAQNLNLF